MYVYWNRNPKCIKIGDCVVRAISEAMNQSWERTYVDLCVEGFMFADMPNSNAVWDSYLHSKGFKRCVISESCPEGYTMADFAADNPDGTYIVATGSHVVCIRNGKILDNWDSSDEMPTFYYKRKDD